MGTKILFVTGLSAIGVSTFMLTRPSPVPFHVEMNPMEMRVKGINVFPLVRAVFTNIPDQWRKYLVTKQHAPDPNLQVRDRYDCTGESPYTIEELVIGKVWKVKYEMEHLMLNSPKARADAELLGMNPNSDAYEKKLLAGAESFGEKAKEVAVSDLKSIRECFNNLDDIDGEDLVKIPSFSINSFVIKLASGSLLLYAPVRVRDETGFGQWLDSLGRVDWIIAASAFHTLSLPGVIKRYPEAKIVGSPAAEAKLKHVNALTRQKFDYNSTNVDDLNTANAILNNEGVQLLSIDGDVLTNALLAIVDKNILLECDLIYTHDDEEGCLMMDQERYRQFLPEDWADRTFKFTNLCKPNSPNGFLPSYRFQLMNPNSLGALNFDLPASDGSSCNEMAGSLRQVLQFPFSMAAGVHINPMTREKFRRSIDKNWNWLDGNSLVD